MTDYIDKSLGAREVVLVRGRFPTAYWVGAVAVLLVLGPVLIGVFLFVGMAIHMATTKFAVTNQRVILKRGFLRRATQELSTESIEGVELQQSILGRLFGYGRLLVRGNGEAVIAFPNMADPIVFRRAVEAGRESARAIHFDPAGAHQLEAIVNA